MSLLFQPDSSFNKYTPRKLTWLAGKSPFLIGKYRIHTSSFMVDVPASHVRFLGGQPP